MVNTIWKSTERGPLTTHESHCYAHPMPTLAELEGELRVTSERYRAARSRFAAAVRIFEQAPARDNELAQALSNAENAFIHAWTAFTKARDALKAAHDASGGGSRT
jgi:hypothetical protein